MQIRIDIHISDKLMEYKDDFIRKVGWLIENNLESIDKNGDCHIWKAIQKARWQG